MANLRNGGNKTCIVTETVLTPPVNLPFLVLEIKERSFG